MLPTIILYVLWGIPLGTSAVCLVKLIDLKVKVDQLDRENTALWATVIDAILNDGGEIKKAANEAKKAAKKKATKKPAKKSTNKKGAK